MVLNPFKSGNINAMPGLGLLLIGLVVSLVAAAPPALAQNLRSQADLAALYSLRASLGLRSRDWPRKVDPCAAWVGVGCSADGRVVSLSISGLRRTRLGRMDPRFAVDGLQNLTRLGFFNASGFALPGPIPDWFGSRLPSTLAVLDLSNAAVTGDIPSSLGGAASLAILALSGNAITGAIPDTLASLSRLAVLDLSFNFLSGSIPPSLGTLPNLTTLLLFNNSLTGSIPPQLGDLSALLNLDLGANLLLGSIPDDLKNLRSLQRLNLGNNSLSGPLPASVFSGLSRLRSLTVSRNNFSGALPDAFWSLPELVFVDAAYNNLTGILPDLASAGASTNATGAAFNLSNNLYYGSIPSGFSTFFSRFVIVDLSDNYFQGLEPVIRIQNATFDANCFRNAPNQKSPADCQEFYTATGLPYDGPVDPIPPAPAPSPSGKKSGWSVKYILIGVFGGLAFLVIMVVVIAVCVMRCGAHGAEQRGSSGNAVPSGSGAPQLGTPVKLTAIGDSFTYEQLLRATSEFDDANLIKHGHSGDLYHGILESGVPVVVKKIDLRLVRRDAHVVELELFANNSHTRLVPFIGHCLENENEKFLVYKYLPNGDLSNALYRKSGKEEEGMQSLDWVKRLKIATGVAEALCFLHHECSPPIVHRDIQASSILLDDKFEVRLGSLSEVCAQEGEGHQNVITRFLRLSQSSEQGTSGSPSATCTYDVYCFGKVLLELVTGKLGISASSDAATSEWLEKTLPYINIYEKELVTKIVDPLLVVDEDFLEEVWAMAIVAKSCLNPRPTKRPLMRYILKALENPLKVVREENNTGSARLRATSSHGSWNAAVFGSWRQSSSEIPAPPREERALKRSATTRSQSSGGEHSFSHRRPSKEIFPEPSGSRDTED